MFESVCPPGISFSRINKGGEGRVYELYSADTKTLAMRFIRAIPAHRIPPLYYIVVETPEGNFGVDCECIYIESPFEVIEEHEAG